MIPHGMKSGIPRNRESHDSRSCCCAATACGAASSTAVAVAQCLTRNSSRSSLAKGIKEQRISIIDGTPEALHLTEEII